MRSAFSPRRLGKRLSGSAEEPLAAQHDALDRRPRRSFNAMLDISRLDAGTIEPNVQQFALRDVFRRLHMHFAGQAELQGTGPAPGAGRQIGQQRPAAARAHPRQPGAERGSSTPRRAASWWWRARRARTSTSKCGTPASVSGHRTCRASSTSSIRSDAASAPGPGLGIGLAIVKRLAILLGHELTVTSRPGRGTMFRIGVALGGPANAQEGTPADTLPMLCCRRAPYW